MRKILLITIGLVVGTSGQACDCDYIGNFLTVSKWAEVILVVKVKEHGDYITLRTAAPTPVSVPTTATFEVVRALKGSIDKKEVRVFGDNGVLCRPYIDTFKKDQYYLVGLYRCDGTQRNETAEDFLISGCGEFWITYNQETNTVTGRIKNRKRKASTMTMEAFEKLLKARGNARVK